nr:hypothetical protein [Tanacetum cinerariifolium]
MDIVQEVSRLHKKGMDLLGFIKKKVGNDENTLFWEESWKDVIPFKSLYPRLFALEFDKKVMVAAKMANSDLCSSLRRMPRSRVEHQQLMGLRSKVEGLILPNMRDHWYWSVSGNGDFSIASVRNFN